MIVLTSRANKLGGLTYSPVLRGELVAAGARMDGNYALECRGEKRETGEAYQFRVLVNAEEIKRIARMKK